MQSRRGKMNDSSEGGGTGLKGGEIEKRKGEGKEKERIGDGEATQTFRSESLRSGGGVHVSRMGKAGGKNRKKNAKKKTWERACGKKGERGGRAKRGKVEGKMKGAPHKEKKKEMKPQAAIRGKPGKKDRLI